MASVKKILKKVKQTVFDAIPDKDYIIFESAPDLSDNTKAVFDEMIKRGMNEKYKMIWVVKDKNADLPKIKNVVYVDTSTKSNAKEYKKYALGARCFLHCNKVLYKYKTQQFSFFLTHGSPMKTIRGHYIVPQHVDCCLSASKDFEKITAYEHSFDENKMISLGFPRNDVLCQEAKDLHPFFEQQYKKIIVWYPTYRQHKNGCTTGAANALPIIHDEKKARELNECAVKNNVLIVLKPHFAQDISYVEDLKLSNIMFINDTFFDKTGLSSYEFVGSCDALLTDYSSIYFDYTLCNKPIGVIWEDIEEYKKNPGFAVDLDCFMQGAEKIYELDELKTFVEHVADGEDILKEERAKVRDMVNYSTDGKSSERVVDFIIEKAGL